MTEATPNSAARQGRNNDDDIDIGFLLGSLWDHKIFIGLLAVVFALAGLAYATLSTPIYQADALVQVEKKSGTISGANMQSMLGQQESSTSTEIEILGSRLILGQVVDQTDLDLDVQPTNLPIVGAWLRRIGVERPSFLQAHASVWAGETLVINELVTSHKSNTLAFSLRSLGNGRYQLHNTQGEPLGQDRKSVV